MDNYEGIIRMNRQQLEAFLDGVYCTGLNDGMYAARLSEEEAVEALEKNPFNQAWLSASAEEAVLQNDPKGEEAYLLDALVASVLRNAEINAQGNDSDQEDGRVVF